MTSPVHPSAAPGAVGALRTDARRFELYVRLSLYALLLFELPFALAVVAASTSWSPLLLAYAGGMVLQTGLNIAICRWSLTSMRRTRLWPVGRDRILVAVWAGVALLMCVGTAVLITAEPQWRFAALAVLATPAAAASPMWNRRQLTLAVLATVALVVVVFAVGYQAEEGWGFVLGLSLGLVFAVIAFVVSFWASGWMLRVVWALDDARGQAAQLAIAEERLRIARDLHDVFGRTLATVSVKSELAAELVRRGRSEEAGIEIAGVRRIADEAGREVRQVVGGVRAADLGTELAGARSLLDSAGIRCRLDGGPADDLDPRVAGVFAWALREAVTNVIRHSRATECRISLTADQVVRLQVDNDGAKETSGTVSDGHGLVGIGERMTAIGGHVSHRVQDGRFVLQAAAPVRLGTAVAR